MHMIIKNDIMYSFSNYIFKRLKIVIQNVFNKCLKFEFPMWWISFHDLLDFELRRSEKTYDKITKQRN